MSTRDLSVLRISGRAARPSHGKDAPRRHESPAQPGSDWLRTLQPWPRRRAACANSWREQQQLKPWRCLTAKPALRRAGATAFLQLLCHIGTRSRSCIRPPAHASSLRRRRT